MRYVQVISNMGKEEPKLNRSVLFSLLLCTFLLAACGQQASGAVSAASSAPAPAVSSSVPESSSVPTPVAASVSEPELEPELETVDFAVAGQPLYGENLGTVAISGTKVSCDLYYGDADAQLNAGAGIYMGQGGKLPGEGGTVLVAGHTGTYFRDFESAEIGADITLDLSYGEYHYEIVDMQVVEATDTTTYDLNATEENLILYTCYPFGQLSPTPYRYFIYGKFVSGPAVTGRSMA